jgi:hypothetical protein
MKLLVLGAVIGATLFAALPASAEVVVRAGENGVAIRERDHDNNWRRHHAECRTVKERVTLRNGDVIYKTRHTC